jgi:crossover junction endodeoxyribonuclease RuvC
VVLLCGALHGLKVVEYHATEVKAAITGSGSADKIQVQKAVQMVLGRRSFETHDASDALALALCHALRGRSPGSAHEILSKALTPRRKKGRSPTLAESLGLGNYRRR